MPAALQQVNEDFLASLRQSTSPQHQQLESTSLSKKLLSDDVTIDDYKQYLLKMYAVIDFCEKEIFPLVAPVIVDIEKRRKLSLIENDLIYLQSSIPNNTLFKPVINANDVAYSLGFMYVIEGSTLGGRVILKHIKNILQVDENNGGTFFAGYNAITGTLWKDFLQMLSTYAKEMQLDNRIIAGAQDAFNAIHNYFTNEYYEN